MSDENQNLSDPNDPNAIHQEYVISDAEAAALPGSDPLQPAGETAPPPDAPMAAEGEISQPIDPSQSTESILVDAIPEQVLQEEAAAPAAPEPSPPAASAWAGVDTQSSPSFELIIPALDAEQKAKLKNALEASGLPPDYATGERISRLNEFLAASLQNSLISMGVLPELRLSWPGDGESLEASPPSEAVAEAEGAPEVVLADKNVLLYTMEESLSLQVLEWKGMIAAHKSIARRFFREEEMQAVLDRELEKLKKGSRTLFPSRFQKLLRELFQDLEKQALSHGANAVFGVKLQAFRESEQIDPGLDQMRLVALGTAAIVQK